MVVLAAASPGQWLIDVIATEVNVGNPRQGFAVVATGPIAPDPAPAADGNRTVRRTEPLGTIVVPP
jgi:hypothetical protein